ncbi:MAG: tRNA (adenosine(37)-N6)-threonylcarbamoyltransferase complex dimerization subunit type 1 TsaB [Pseudobdellovibrionaceae bacterium]
MAVVLAVESSTALASVCLRDNRGNEYFRESWQQRAHSEYLNQAIAEVLEDSKMQLSQVDLFCTTLGPGSFTGIRVSGNIIKTFAYLYHRPIFTMTSRQLLALGSQNQDPKICLINAFKNMVYAAGYSGDQVIFEPMAIRFDEVSKLIEKFPHKSALALGDALKAYPLLQMNPGLSFKEDEFQYPHARTLARIALSDPKFGQTMVWNSCSPLYIRASEAEENLKRF